MARQNTCAQCKKKYLNKKHTGILVDFCVWYGDQGRPPFSAPNKNANPETMYLEENRPILAKLWYCENCK